MEWFTLQDQTVYFGTFQKCAQGLERLSNICLKLVALCCFRTNFYSLEDSHCEKKLVVVGHWPVNRNWYSLFSTCIAYKSTNSNSMLTYYYLVSKETVFISSTEVPLL